MGPLRAVFGVAAIVALVGWLIAHPLRGAPPAASSAIAAPAITTAVAIPVAVPADPVEAGLQRLSCAWVEASGAPGAIKLTGAGIPGWSQAVDGVVPHADKSRVLTVAAAPCELLSAIRPLRQASDRGGAWVTPSSAIYTPAKHADCGGDPGLAQVIVNARVPTAAGQTSALYLLAPNGAVSSLDPKARPIAGAGPSRLLSPEPGRLTLSLCLRDPGAYGVLALRGNAPFANGDSGDLATGLAASAAHAPWRAQMSWFQVRPAPIQPVVAPAAPPRAEPAPQTRAAKHKASVVEHHAPAKKKPPKVVVIDCPNHEC
jgi:hypothetical protein